MFGTDHLYANLAQIYMLKHLVDNSFPMWKTCMVSTGMIINWNQSALVETSHCLNWWGNISLKMNKILPKSTAQPLPNGTKENIVLIWTVFHMMCQSHQRTGMKEWIVPRPHFQVQDKPLLPMQLYSVAMSRLMEELPQQLSDRKLHNSRKRS